MNTADFRTVVLDTITKPSMGAGSFFLGYDAFIVVAGKRYNLGGFDSTMEGRLVHAGPLERGPHAWLNADSSCLAANPEHGTWGSIRRAKAAGNWHELEVGDVLVLRTPDGKVSSHQIIDGGRWEGISLRRVAVA